MEQKDVVDALREERTRLASFLEGLTDEAWDGPTDCKGWNVRQLVAHLVGNLADVLSARYEDFGSEAFNQRQVDERASHTPAQLLAEWAEVGPKAEWLFGAIPPENWEEYLPPIAMTTGEGVQRLLEDLWVHAQDIRLPLGHPILIGPGLQAACEIVVGDLPARVRTLAPSVGTVSIDVGDFRARLELGDGAEVRITGQPVTFVFAGTGRLSIDAARAEGLHVDPVPDGFAEALNIYGTYVEQPRGANAR